MDELKINKLIEFVRNHFNAPNDFIPLHAPVFSGNERAYVNETIDSTFVSSVGGFVTRFEKDFSQYIGANYGVATVNGTAALHIALLVSGIEEGDEVITQSLSFVATANPIRYCRASPVFLDVERDTLGLSPKALTDFLEANSEQKDGVCYNKKTKKRIHSIIPMHVFGHPCRIDEIVAIAKEYNIIVIEDAAESAGSKYKGKALGTFGDIGIFSFNGNKTITCGGGGVLVTDNEKIAEKAKHLTTTAKKAHKWEYNHDEVGYNYRMPNLNAALACAQLEQLDSFILNKRDLALKYSQLFDELGVEFILEPREAYSNYWLNAIICKDKNERNLVLDKLNGRSIMCRPLWHLISDLEMYKDYQSDDLVVSRWLQDRVVNIPSSVTL